MALAMGGRYTESATCKQMNIQFCRSEKAVYRSFNKRTETQNNEIPASTEVETFWLKLWTDERTSLKLNTDERSCRYAEKTCHK
jgi:hypothetical protein